MNEEKRDKRRERGDKTREAIINAAASIIMESGLQGLTSRAISERANIGRGSLFHHFKDMNEIIVAAAEKLMDNYLREMNLEGCKTIKEVLDAVSEFTITYAVQYVDLTALMGDMLDLCFKHEYLKGKLRDMMYKFLNILQEQLRTRLPASVEEGRLVNAAWMIFILLDNINLYYYLTRDEAIFRNMWKDMPHIIENYLLGAEKEA